MTDIEYTNRGLPWKFNRGESMRRIFLRLRLETGSRNGSSPLKSCHTLPLALSLSVSLHLLSRFLPLAAHCCT